jgi:nitrite reductase/ring-hydroxylating ferredoxin subunit
MSLADAGDCAADGADWERLPDIDPAAGSFPAPARWREEPIWIFRTRTGFRGVQEHCPHQNVALGTAKLLGNDTMIRCALHGLMFRLEDGSGANCRLSIRIFEVREQDGILFVRPRS